MPQIANVLIVEDLADWLDIYATALVSEEYQITTAQDVEEASELLAQREFAVVATDLKLVGAMKGGFDILEIVRKYSPDTQVIIFTGVGGKQDAFEATWRGAFDYVTKPLDYDHVKRVIKAAIDVRQQRLDYRRNMPKSRDVELPFPEKFLGSSQPIKRVLRQVAEVIESTRPVLICGATGTGKALISETIHLASKRKHFVLLNCASFSETTLERTLFGFQKGAFPGAVEDEPGLLEQATGGTLVFDRVNGLSPRLQSQLVSAFRAQRARRIGSTQAFTIDTKVLATSPIDLKTHVSQGLFSTELYEYLGDSIIELPTLKERKDEHTDDILLLAGYFLDKYTQAGNPPPTISVKAMNLLQSYDFPGNVRELEEAIRVAIIKAKSGVIEPYHLPEQIQNWQPITRSVTVKRSSLPEKMICPHGHSLSDQAETIAREFDTGCYVYISFGDDLPTWYQPAIVDILTQFGLKPYEVINFPADKNFCPICQPIISSQLAIFDVSDTHSTVLYKLGIAHANGLYCLILRKKGGRRSETLKDIEVHEYHDEVSLRSSILAWLDHLSS